MIFGGDRVPVVKNIQKNIKDEELNRKVEVGDPVFTDEDSEAALARFNKWNKQKIRHAVKQGIAYIGVEYAWLDHKARTSFDGIEKLESLKGGAILTCNHFNHIDSIFPRAVLQKTKRKNPYIVIQDTNLNMPGLHGFLMNNLRMIPILKKPSYLLKTLVPQIKNLVADGEFVLIYPEEEMWYNYRKPRPCKRGTYLFAAQAGVPVLPIWVELRATDIEENAQFYKLKYIVHVLEPIYPDAEKTDRQNSIDMAKADYEQRVAAYEEAFNEKLDYKFSYDDIVGFRKDSMKTSSNK